jgi:hypothetical protein
LPDANHRSCSHGTMTAQTMRQGLWDYYHGQGHDAPLDGNAWRAFSQPAIPIDPDEGLLIQDSPWAAPYQSIPGYKDQAHPEPSSSGCPTLGAPWPSGA